nr:TonB-dependent receptor [Flavobacteriales bacterium]
MRKILLTLFIFVGYFGYSQGVTTSSLNGRIIDNNKEPLLGANIVALHTPSGTQYGAITDFNGFYRIPNMRVGGPYQITITYVGFEDILLNDVYLQLGDSERISREMSEIASALDAVIITTGRNSIFDANQTGSNTNVSTREINTLPSITRSIADFVRKTPEAQVSENGAIALGGQNNRYNAIYIDGAVSNDVFGLAASGTNGGQTGVSPISLDAIESFQINLAPFDVRQSGFAGGSINAITRAGTNNEEGSAYYFFRNQNLAGLTPTGINEEEREKLSDFTAKTFGARLGGSIIKDKLFYFINYERQEDQTPQPFDISNYRGDSNQADLDALRQGLISRFGYDPGGFDQNTRELNSDKIIARIDWKINDKNSIILKNSYVESENIGPSQSGNTTINFFNGGVSFPSVTNSTTLEWNTTNGSNMSNNLVLGYTTVKDDRNPLGNPFPRVRIDDGSGNIFLGSEPFSTANLLEQQLFTITNNFEYYAGRHKFTLGANVELFDVKNVFFGINFGEYRYESLSDFSDVLAGMDVEPSTYVRNYSLLGGSGDNSLGAAEFRYNQYGVYIQDDIDINDRFKLTLGMRIDIPTFEDGLENVDFNTRTVALLEDAGKDLQGARVGKPIESQIHYSPRVGFNWDVHGDKTTQIRGGLGVFTSRIPLVWPGGTYNNNGVSQTGVNQNNLGQPAFFRADPFDQYVRPGQEPGSGATGGNIDIFAPGFKLPQVMKYNFAVDQKLPFAGLIA